MTQSAQSIVFENVFYVVLRLMRRHLFTDGFLSRWGKWIPLFSSNMNQASPVPIVDLYESLGRRAGIRLSGQTVLEIGSGETNSTGYEIMARGSRRYWGFEPYLQLNGPLDRRKKWEVSHRHPQRDPMNLDRVRRIRSLETLSAKSIDVVVSHCVLEHVKDMDTLVQRLARVLKGHGCMIHYVDYRDHFFQYPYHFLLFSNNIWSRLLNPGSLPRYRISDHIDCFLNHGFEVNVLSHEADPERFQQIEDRIDPCFLAYDREALMTTFAALHVRFQP